MLFSIYTAALGYTGATISLMVTSLVAMVVELWWIKVVWRRFPILAIDEEERRLLKQQLAQGQHISRERAAIGLDELPNEYTAPQGRSGRIMAIVKRDLGAWREFSKIPICYSESIPRPHPIPSREKVEKVNKGEGRLLT
jgi:hypothetical protein